MKIAFASSDGYVLQPRMPVNILVRGGPATIPGVVREPGAKKTTVKLGNQRIPTTFDNDLIVVQKSECQSRGISLIKAAPPAGKRADVPSAKVPTGVTMDFSDTPENEGVDDDVDAAEDDVSVVPQPAEVEVIAEATGPVDTDLANEFDAILEAQKKLRPAAIAKAQQLRSAVQDAEEFVKQAQADLDRSRDDLEKHLSICKQIGITEKELT